MERDSMISKKHIASQKDKFKAITSQIHHNKVAESSQSKNNTLQIGGPTT